MVCGGPLYFSKTYWLSGALISVIHSHRRQFSVPRYNAHRAERLMEKEMKLITRSQTRRVIGKVCLMAGTISLCQGKASKSAAQEVIFTQPKGEYEFVDGYE